MNSLKSLHCLSEAPIINLCIFSEYHYKVFLNGIIQVIISIRAKGGNSRTEEGLEWVVPVPVSFDCIFCS